MSGNKALFRLYQSDMSLAEIARQLHVSLSTLKSKIRELGLKREPRLKKKAINEKLFKELVQRGLSNVNIAQKFHISVSTVIKHKKQLGIFSQDEERTARAKKAATCRAYYKKTGTKPEYPFGKNVLEKHKKAIIPLLEHGVSKTKIANRYGVSLSTVYNFIYLYNLNAPVRKICDGREDVIKETFDTGKSLEDISKKLNCHTSTIRRAVKGMHLRRNLQSVKRKSLLNNQKETIKNLYNQGVPSVRIAQQLGVSSTSMYAYIHKMQFSKPQNQVKRCTSFSKREAELLKIRQKGMSLRKIAVYFGVHVNTVLYRLKKLSKTSMKYSN